MNYNMYQNRMNDSVDQNYIYPQPYIDPIMYMSPYTMNDLPAQNYNPNYSLGNINANPQYSIYSNQYVDNPQLSPYDNISDANINSNISNSNMETNNNMNNDMNGSMNNVNQNMNSNIGNNMDATPNNIPIIPMMPSNMFSSGMMPPNMVHPNMIYPGMMPPNMMYPHLVCLPNMMYPGMMPNMPAINMEEFDEEEM